MVAVRFSRTKRLLAGEVAGLVFRTLRWPATCHRGSTCTRKIVVRAIDDVREPLDYQALAPLLLRPESARLGEDGKSMAPL